MSLLDEERGLWQKRDGPRGGTDDCSSDGPRVSDSRKRKLTPSDSGSDGYQASSHWKAANRVDRSRKSTGGRKRNDVDVIKHETNAGKRRILRSDVAKERGGVDAAKKKVAEGVYLASREEEVQAEKRRVLRSDVAKQREETSAHLKTVTEASVLSAGQNGKGSCISGSNGTELNAEEEAGANKKKVREDTCISKKKITEEVAPEAANGDSSSISERDGSEQITCEEEIKVDKKRITRSGAARQREDADVVWEEVTQETNTDERKVKEEVAPGADQQGISSTIHKTSSTDQTKNEEEIKVEKKRSMRTGGAKRRKEANTEDIRVEKKRITRSCVAKQGKEAGTNKKKATDKADGDTKNATVEGAPMIKYEDEGKVEKKRITRSDVAKKMEETETFRKKVPESGFGRKRSREVSDAETTGKKLRTELLRHRQDQTRQKEGQSGKKTKPIPKKISRLEGEKIRRIKRSGQRTVRRLQDNSAYPVGAKRKDYGSMHHKGIGLLGREGVQKALSSYKNASGFEKSHKDEENRTIFQPPSSGNQNAGQRSLLYGGRRNLKKLSSTVLLGKSRLSMEKTSSAEKKISHEAKIGYKPNNVDSSNGKGEVMVEGESKRSKEASIERRIAKQKLRDQIKDVLLNAGWKIDLRPRQGKSYDDSVYISPQGPGYWSITKAYDVFLSQMNCTHGDKGKNSLGKPSKTSKGSDNNCGGTSSPFSAIPIEALSILKKVIVHRRRSRKEMEEAKKKLEDGSRSKKAKGATGIKRPKNKHSKDRGREVKERIKENNIMGSSSKGTVGHTRKKPHPVRSGEKQRGMALLARGSNQETKTGAGAYVPYLCKRTILSWMIDLGAMPASGKVKYMNQNRTQAMLEGWITRNGIHCSCCSKILTVSMFEIHAGSELCQPYQNICLAEAGISLLECQLNAWEKQDESVRQSFYSIDTDGDDPNDDTCGICGDGGDLICCDGCPSTFHLSCLGIQMLPPGDWHCTNCSCRFCGLVSGADAQENGGTVSPLLSCSQCEEKYHHKCVPEGHAIPFCSNLPCVPFCGQSCKKLFKQLQRLLGVKNDLESGFSWTLLQRFDEDLPESVCALDQRVECNSKIAVALAVMDECFLPIVDQRSGINLIHNVVYNCGSNFNRLNYRGFYTFTLERDDEIISVASLRIHGTRLAEMPFIGTRNMYRRQGMCRRLLNGIESALCSLNIEKLIIPAISELTDTWTSVFGFKPIEVTQRQEVRSINMLVFPGTGLLLKPLLKEDSTEHCKTDDGVDKFEHHTPEIANESSVCSFLVLELNASDEVIVHGEHEVKDREPSTSEVSPESSDAPHGSEPQASEYKSLDTANNEELLHPEAVYHDERAVVNDLQPAASLESQVKLPSEDNVHLNSEVKSRDACVVSVVTPVDPKIHAVGAGIVHSVHELKGQLATVREKPFVDDGDAERCAYIIETSPDVAPGKESRDSCVSSAGYDNVIVSIHAAPLHSAERSIEHISELQQKPPRSLCDAELPFVTDKLHHSKHDLVNLVNVTSLPEPAVSFGCEGIHNSYETNDDAAYVENNLYALSKSSVRCTTGMVKSLDATLESNSSYEAYVSTPDGVNRSQRIVAKGSTLLAPGVTDSCASTEGVVLDNHSLRLEDGPVAVSHPVIAEASVDHARESGVVPDHSNLTSGRLLNKFSDSSRDVQHNFAMTNKTAVAIPVEPCLACYEGRHDTNGLEADISAVKPDLHAFGECSMCHASKVVSKSLNNGLQSTLEYADVGNVQHSKFFCRSCISTSGVSPLPAGVVGSYEIHEVVSGANQHISLVPRHDSAD